MSEYETLAKNVLRKTVALKPKENVIVETWNHGLPIAAEFVYQARALGARPMLWLEDEETFWRAATTLPESKVGTLGGHEWKAIEEADAYVFVPGPADIAKIREVGTDRWDAATAYNDEWYRRAKRARLRGARIGLGYVTPQRASSYGLDLEEWRAAMLAASSVSPEILGKRAQRLRRVLERRGRIEVTAQNGTSFSCDLVGRHAVVEDGVVDKDDLDRGEIMANIPAGEITVAPDEKSAEGTIVFDRPVASLGRWLKGLRFAFDGGKLSKWTATENSDAVQRQWDRATGDRDRIAYIDFGLNPKARTGFLHDYIVAGNVYIAVGDNDEAGGKNKTGFFLGSTVTGTTVRINGTTVVRGGRLVP